MKIETEERKSTRLDFQFCCAVYVRSEYESNPNKASNLYSDHGGVEFSNSFKSGIEHARGIVKQNPEYLCVVIDLLNRKKPIVI
jgi:hypothetical protein